MLLPDVNVLDVLICAHRELRPSNEARVADFGLAKPAAAQGDGAISGTGAMVGTPSYFARSEREERGSIPPPLSGILGSEDRRARADFQKERRSAVAQAGEFVLISRRREEDAERLARFERPELFFRNGDETMAVSLTTTGTVAAGRPRRLFSGNYASDLLHNYDVSSDGQHFLMIRENEEDARPRFHVILNWG